MSYQPFKDCRLTTMTLVFVLDGSVSLDEAFALLPVTRLNIAQPKRQKKKVELPHCDKPGAILSMRYRGDTRGIVRSTSSNFFKNSITIDLSTKSKNVSIKLSQTKIQMCGASSEEVGREGAQYLINHLLEIQDIIEYMKANPEKAKETKDWLIASCKGDNVERPIYKIVKRVTRQGDELQQWEEQVFSHMEKDFSLILPKIEEAPDKRIAELLLRQQGDFEFHSFFVSEIDWIMNVTHIATRNLGINKIVKAMVNYNYNLGFIVDRGALHDLMIDRKGFISSYDNCVEHCVKIKLPYINEKDEGSVRRKSKVPCHCFLIYKSGVVTQTGPGDEKMEKAYNLFRDCIEEIKSKIILDQPQVISERA